MGKPIWKWTRLIPAKWEDSWAERLRFLGDGKVVFVGWPGSRSLRVEAFADKADTTLLVRQFGGRAVPAKSWTGDPVKPRKPLAIRRKLRIYSDQNSCDQWNAKSGRPLGVLVPAGIAFGTGEHVTTASCLRMLADASERTGPEWTALDAGTGSGILAIAAEALGAAAVDAFDFDPDSVRTARANAKANRCSKVRIFAADVLDWEPSQACDVVTANLFSELLIRALPVLRTAVRPDGHFIFSGVLREQLPEVIEAVGMSGLSVERTVVRGKWSAGHCRAQSRVVSATVSTRCP